MKYLCGSALALTLGVYLLLTHPFSEVKAQQGDAKQPAGVSATENPAFTPLESQRTGQGEPGEMPLYKPPQRGAPGGRLAGGTRGTATNLPPLAFLAPSHTGLTIAEQPTLYWFSSESAKCPVEFTILMGKTAKHLLQVRLSPRTEEGIHPIPLADHGIRLQVGETYQCFITIVTDPKQRSKDLISGGAIERVPHTDTLRKKLQGVDGRRTTIHIFAEEGLWYDALAAVSERIDSAPDDLLARRQRISLLHQAGLTKAAEFEMKHSMTREKQ